VNLKLPLEHLHALTAGGYREIDGDMFIGDVEESDLWIFSAGQTHSIQDLGPDGTEFLLVFNSVYPVWLRTGSS
jgi:hypothetical protein